jgi:hypothetical protein
VGERAYSASARGRLRGRVRIASQLPAVEAALSMCLGLPRVCQVAPGPCENSPALMVELAGSGGASPLETWTKALKLKQKFRYRHKPKRGGLIGAWPSDRPSPADVSRRVSYVGSGEHKARPVHESYQVEAALRSDASRCDSRIDRLSAERALRSAIERGCVSLEFEGDFPCYVWGWVDGQPHVARLINRELGQYKGWPIPPEELPIDPDGRLTPPKEASNA